jgi:hypothetical protein
VFAGLIIEIEQVSQEAFEVFFQKTDFTFLIASWVWRDIDNPLKYYEER